MGIAIGDYDMDLDLDYYITNLGENALFRNEGNGQFTNQTIQSGVQDTYSENGLLSVGWGTGFLDFDNDADLDLYVVNGQVPAVDFIANGPENANRLFLNNGKGIYSKITGHGAESTMRARGFAAADIDLDGDLDFIVVNETGRFTDDTIQNVQLFRNDLEGGQNWIEIKLEGKKQNKDGIGSRIYVVANGKRYIQEANGGYGTHASQHSNIVHFGLGKASYIDSLLVIWPGGMQQIHSNIAPNQLLTIKEGEFFIDQESPENIPPILTAFPNPFSEQIQIAYILPLETSVEVEIFDAMGKMVYRHWVENQKAGKETINWTVPSVGSYFVRLKTRESYAYQTIIKQ